MEVVLARHVEHPRFAAFEQFGHGVELLGLGQVRHVAGMQNERGRTGSALILATAAFKVLTTSLFGGLVEADVAVADLDEEKCLARARLASLAKDSPGRESAGDGPEHAGPAQAMHSRKPRRSTPSASQRIVSCLVMILGLRMLEF